MWHQEIRCILFTACPQPQSGIHPCFNTATQLHKLSNKAGVVFFKCKFVWSIRPDILHMWNHSIIHIDSTAGWVWVLCGKPWAVSSLQGLHWAFEIMVAHHCLQTPDLHTHFSAPPSHYCCCLWMGYASYSLTVNVDVEMTQMQGIPGGSRLQWREARCEKKWKWSAREFGPLASTCFEQKCQYLGQF